MKFPEFIKPGDTIGVTAPSGGAYDETDKNAFMAAKETLESMGYKVIFTDSVFKTDGFGRSADKETRAKEFMELIENPAVKYICSAKGGDYLCEIQPYLDYEKIKNNPKWIQGYSDNTFLTLGITTCCDIATVYGHNFGRYGMEEWHSSIKENLMILEGKLDEQKNYESFQNGFVDTVTGREGYQTDTPVELKLYNGNISETEAKASGRLIGGCLDVVIDIIGTKYEDIKGFVDKYKDDGIIWYFESFINSTDGVIRNMWKMKELGWFENTKAILFGRELFYNEAGMTFDEASMSVLGELGIPVIFGTDIGHKPPQMCMINGAICDVSYKNGELSTKYIM